MKNKKIIVLQGPPASGKSTYAHSLAKPGTPYVIVSRDAIREARGEYWVPEQEEYISDLEEYGVRSAIKRDLIPIIDATNLNPKTIAKWESIAKEFGCEIEYKKFYVPFKEALERDSNRERSVGKKTLIQFYSKYFYNEYVKEVGWDNRKIKVNTDIKTPCVVFDLDGTCMLHRGRLPYDWTKLSTDEFDSRIIEIISKLHLCAVKIIFLTGRPESVRNETNEVLKKYVCDYTLIMRKTNDYRSGNIVKRELWEKHVEPNYNTLCVFEDSNKCVDMWRDLGLLTCQVANGDY